MNVKVVAEKMKIAMETNSFSELAEKLDITLATIDSWKRRNAIPNKYLLKVTENTGVSLDWLMNDDKTIDEIVKQGFVKNGTLELFEEFTKIEKIAKIADKMDFLKAELEKIKAELIKHI